MNGFAVLLILGGIVYAFASGSSQRKRLELALASLSAELEDGAYDLRKRLVWGDLGGASVRLRYLHRGSGDNPEAWTEIETSVPPQYPLRLFVRKHAWRDAGKIERGELVDVIVDDPAFDDRFLVEAAPADVARVLLDERERAYLLELSERRQLEITSDAGKLQLALRSWVMDVPDVSRGIEAIVAIAGRLRDAYAAVEPAAEARSIGSPYRPVLDDGAAREAADARLAEVERLDALRTARAASEQFIATVVILGFVVFAIAAVAVSP